ncbi:hypothetical protein WN944_008137 [Citrus x changshan-huyou]|uniref:Uncharacterized protein n=1 Tax=Citrus x changshan-huyou TaxID=2935761 RepID=A0AAP0MTQ6_9ROSI
MAATVILVTTRVTVSFTMSLRKMRRDCTGEVKVSSRVVGEEESHSAGTGRANPFLNSGILPRHASVTLIGGSTAL